MPHRPNYIKVYQFIVDTIERRGCRPTFRQIMEHFGFSGTNAVRCHLDALHRHGYIKFYINNTKETYSLVRLPDGSPFEGFRAVRDREMTPARSRDGGIGPAEADTRTQSLPSR
jgi:SOS-response transcriptional repressor LexA